MGKNTLKFILGLIVLIVLGCTSLTKGDQGIVLKVDSTMSLQKLIDEIPEGQKTTIYLKNGVYKEKLVIDKSNLTLIGENSKKTVIDWNDAAGTPVRGQEEKTYGTSGSATVLIKSSASGFTVKNLTFSNSFDYHGSNLKDKQGVAVRNDADQSSFYNVRFLGYQDTLYANTGRQYYKNSYIEGNVDFVFGAAQAYFENCEFFSKDRKDPSNNGYVFAPSTSEKEEFGYVIVNSKLVSNAAENSVSLGRPWHPGKKPGTNPSAVIINSEIGAHIKDIAWASMSGFSPDNARFYEYNNKGLGAKSNPNRRILTSEIVKKYNKENVFKNWIIK